MTWLFLAITSQAIARSFWKTQDSSIYPFCRNSLTVTLSLHASALCSEGFNFSTLLMRKVKSPLGSALSLNVSVRSSIKVVHLYGPSLPSAISGTSSCFFKIPRPRATLGPGRRQIEGTAVGLAAPVTVSAGTGEKVLYVGLQPHTVRHHPVAVPAMRTRPIRDISPNKGHNGLAVGQVSLESDPTTIPAETGLANDRQVCDPALNRVARLPAGHLHHVIHDRH